MILLKISIYSFFLTTAVCDFPKKNNRSKASEIILGRTFAYLHCFINQIKRTLDSECEKRMFENYWNGTGNLLLSTARFHKISAYLNSVINFRTASGYDVMLNDGREGKAFIISFYDSEEFDHAFGTATIYTNDEYEIVGFMDYYDFDARPWGERSYKSEAISRMINFVSPKKAKAFKITYGVQYSPPIYDKVLHVIDFYSYLNKLPMTIRT